MSTIVWFKHSTSRKKQHNKNSYINKTVSHLYLSIMVIKSASHAATDCIVL